MRKSSKLIVVAGAIAALAVPSVAAASPGSTGVSTNGTSSDVVGYAVSAGNYNYKNGDYGFTSTGQARKALNAADGPGAVAVLIHGVQAQQATYEAQNGPYAPPSQP